ncbi:MAG: outer membrane lipoprotein-sorting protein [Deltaproteobacteria bacterium]|nr:outer membrane lipoprotein-sorting protein [Deltaproteobacteria bacterium]
MVERRLGMSRYIVILLVTLMPFKAFALSATSAEEVMKGSQAAFLYPGRDFSVRVMMRLLSASGGERIREIAMLRKNYGLSGGDQKYFMYFFQPADVKDMTFMVYKYPGRDDDRWLFVPALNMVRRIAARDKTSSFVGSDFTYEDVSGRDIGDDAHEFIKIEETAGSPCLEKECYKIKSTPKAADVDYGHKLSWIDGKSLLPLKEEYYDKKGELYRVFTADEIQDVKGFPTVTKRTMKNLKSGHATEVTFTGVDYNTGIEDSLFSERYLKQPPRKLIQR